jgi:hypothetical protein
MSLFRPDLIFTNEEGIEITDISFEPIRRGKTTKTITIVVKNQGDDCKNILVKPVILDDSIDEVDTVGSTFISLNNVDFFNEVKLSLIHGETHNLYLKYQPPYNAVPVTNILWGLRLFVDMNEINELSC